MSASISPARKNSSSYYTLFEIENYYSEGDTKRGWWEARGAAALGLTGSIVKEDFEQLYRGFTPDKRLALVQNAGSSRRRPATDLVLSTCKSVSVLKALSKPETARAISVCVFIATKATIDYLEEHAAFGRVGKNGVERVRAQLIVACYLDELSRAGDPQTHVHCVIMNAGLLDGGRTGSVTSKPFFDHKMTAGQLFRTELAFQLQSRLGLEIVRGTGGNFEIKGVPRDLLREFSQRRADIVRALETKGLTSAKAAAVATLETRPPKKQWQRDELFSRWQSVGQKYEFGSADIENLLHRHTIPVDFIQKDSVLRNAVLALRERESFREQDVVRAVAAESVGYGLNVRTVREMAQEFLSAADLVRLEHGRLAFRDIRRQSIDIINQKREDPWLQVEQEPEHER